jgi:hypothetical protein
VPSNSSGSLGVGTLIYSVRWHRSLTRNVNLNFKLNLSIIIGLGLRSAGYVSYLPVDRLAVDFLDLIYLPPASAMTRSVLPRFPQTSLFLHVDILESLDNHTWRTGFLPFRSGGLQRLFFDTDMFSDLNGSSSHLLSLLNQAMAGWRAWRQRNFIFKMFQKRRFTDSVYFASVIASPIKLLFLLPLILSVCLSL